MGSKISEAERLQIIELYKEKGTYKKVMEVVGHSPTTIWRIITAAGLGKGMGGNQDSQRKITDDELLEAAKTLTVAQIVEKFSIHETNVYRRCNKLGIKAVESGDRLRGLRQNWGNNNKYLKSYEGHLGNVWHYIETQDQTIREYHPQFIYLESKERKIRLKCKRCKNVIEVDRSHLKDRSIVCEFCSEKEKQLDELNQERNKLVQTLLALKELKTPKICYCCGEVFYSQYPLTAYCSKKCKAKTKRQRQKERDPEKFKFQHKKYRVNGKKHISRAKKYGCQYEYGISLDKVIKKYNNVCQICGKPCDKNDKSWGSAGMLYPSIDHIVPLSKGGSHTWDNVQLAHFLCNSKKCDNLDFHGIKRGGEGRDEPH